MLAIMASHKTFLLARDRFPETLRTPGQGILVEVAVEGAMRGRNQFRRGIKIWEALSQIDGSVLLCHPSHVPDSTLVKLLQARRCALHKLTPPPSVTR
jgi:hypothetical protein